MSLSLTYPLRRKYPLLFPSSIERDELTFLSLVALGGFLVSIFSKQASLYSINMSGWSPDDAWGDTGAGR